MAMTQEQRANALGVSARQLRADEQRGCPRNLAGARRWRSQNVLPRARGGEAGELGAASLAHATAIGAETWARVDELQARTISGGDADEIRRIVVGAFEVAISAITEIAPLLASETRPAYAREFLLGELDDVRDKIGRRLRLAAVPETWTPTLRRPRGGSLAAARAWLRDALRARAELRADLRNGALQDLGRFEVRLQRAVAEAVHGPLRGIASRLAHRVVELTDPEAIRALVLDEAETVIRSIDQALAPERKP